MRTAQAAPHYLNEVLFGDCRERLPEIADESVDLILTDPPYNTGCGPRKTGYLGHFFDDSMPAGEYRKLAFDVSRECYRVLRPNRGAYVFINWKSLGIWLEALSTAGFALKNTIVWDKVAHGLNISNYMYSHEFLIFAVKGRFFPNNKRTGDDCFKDLWRIPRHSKRKGATAIHATVKPVELVRRPIEHATEPGDVVLDPFVGSGTTCVVAKMLGRSYIGIEREPSYIQLALSRLAEVGGAALRCKEPCMHVAPPQRRRAVPRVRGTASGWRKP